MLRRLLELKLNAVQQHVGDAQHVRQRLLLDTPDGGLQ